MNAETKVLLDVLTGDPARFQGDWLAEVDQALSAMSWNTTQARMAGLIAEVVDETAVSAGAVA